MSDFRLHDVAPFLEKDAKTLRLWCKAGVVPPVAHGEPVGAFQTPGGHWRISGKSREEVVDFIRARIPKTSRRRRENAYPLAGDRSKTPREAWQTALPGAWRFAERTPKIHATPWGCISKRAPLSEKHRFLEAVAAGVLEQSQKLREDLQREDSEILLRSLLKTLGGHIEHISPESLIPPNFEPLTASRLASECGVSRRTFYRWFPRWRVAVKKLVVAKYRKKLFDDSGGIIPGEDGIDFEEMDTRNGWKESHTTVTP